MSVEGVPGDRSLPRPRPRSRLAAALLRGRRGRDRRARERRSRRPRARLAPADERLGRAGPLPFVQVGLAAAVAALAINRLGAAAWWRAALAGHIGSALIAYALIGLAGAERAAATPDYGVSCVLGASLGALLTVRGKPRVVGIVGTLALAPLSFSWIGLEHPLSIALGAAVTAWRRA